MRRYRHRPTSVPVLVLSVLLVGCGASRKITGDGGFAPLAIQTSELAPGTVGVTYTQTLSATGGDRVYSWSLTEGFLPAGLTLTADGTVSGTPTAAGNSTFIVQVRSGDGQIDTRQLAMVVQETLGGAPALDGRWGL